MQAAYRVSTPMLIPHLHPLFLRRMKGLAARGTFWLKRQQMEFFDPIFLPGRVAVPYRIEPGPWRAAGTWLRSASRLHIMRDFLMRRGK